MNAGRVRKYTSVEALERLGDALREARLNHEPPLRLSDVGSAAGAPRTWSHSHLSKVERGLEVPGADLVQWYEVVTKAVTGSLVRLWETATGEHAPGPAPRANLLEWLTDRVEMVMDLRGERATVVDTRDLIANQPGLSGYWALYDTGGEPREAAEYDRDVLVGGKVHSVVPIDGTTLVKLGIKLGRELDRGEWHRIQIRHVLPAGPIEPYLNFSLRTETAREAILTVHFPDGEWRVWSFIDVYAEALPAMLANPASENLPEDFSVREVPSNLGYATVRIEYPTAGFSSGLVWRLAPGS